jgi:hypothetical protein
MNAVDPVIVDRWLGWYLARREEQGNVTPTMTPEQARERLAKDVK